jgi:hypothetical protein
MIDIPAQVPEIESSDYVAIIRAYPGPDKNKDIFDGVSGIERMHVDRLHAWYDEKKDQRCVAVFDWDRTITKIEGAFLTKDYASIDKTTFAENLNILRTTIGIGPLTTAANCGNPRAVAVGAAVEASELAKGASAANATAAGELARIVDQTLQYLCGGQDRLEMLKNDVFGYCVRNNITVCILTNNDACGKLGDKGFKYSRCFHDLITGLFPVEYRNTPFIIRCSNPSPIPGGQPHKGETLRADPLFGLVCPRAGAMGGASAGPSGIASSMGGVGRSRKRSYRMSRRKNRKRLTRRR